MSALTVVSVGEKTLGIVSARATPGGVELLRASHATLEGEDGVRKAIAACGGADVKVVLVVPRSMAILREFDVPAGSPEELLQMVRFQIEKELPLPMEQVRYSYVESAGPNGKVHISAAAVPVAQFDALTKALADAGCKAVGAYVSSFGLANLFPRDATLEGGSALVGLADGGAEILILDATGALVLSRSIPLKEVSPAGLAAEVNRTILSWTGRGEGRVVKRVLLAGEGPQVDQLAAGLKEHLKETVDRIVLNGNVTRKADVTVGPDTAAAAGVCVGALQGKHSMPDILHTPVVKRVFRLKKAHRIAILSTAIAVTLLAWSRMALSDRQTELASLRTEIKKLDPEAQEVLATQQRTRLAGQWMSDRYAWIDTMSALAAKIDPKKIWLTGLVVDDTGFMRMQGKTTDDDLVGPFVKLLQRESDVFKKVETEYTKPSSDKSAYKFDFAIKIQLVGLSNGKKK